MRHLPFIVEISFLKNRYWKERKYKELLENNLIARIFAKKDKEVNNHLSEIVDIDKDLQVFKQNQLKLLDPKILYNSRYFSRNDLLYRHYKEEQISVLGNNMVQLNLVNPESIKNMKKTSMTLMHMGLVVLGIKGLARKNLGSKVLAVVYDDRWSDLKKSIIGLTEIDMTNNGGICYISPDFLINLEDEDRSDPDNELITREEVPSRIFFIKFLQS